MIPKIIHYCWFGRGEKPQSVLDYIETWKKHCPDYKIKEWNEENFDVDALAYTKEAYCMKKYAFVSDVARLVALKNEGGVYLDTDVELVKPLDSILDNRMVLSREAPCKVSTAVIGAEKGNFLISGFLDSYKTKHFISENGYLNTLPNTIMLSRFINENFWKYKGKYALLDIDILCAKIWPTGELYVTDRTIAIHQFQSSWLTEDEQEEKGLMNRIKASFIFRRELRDNLKKRVRNI